MLVFSGLCQPSQSPLLLAPADGDSLIGNDPVFSWEGYSASSYSLKLCRVYQGQISGEAILLNPNLIPASLSGNQTTFPYPTSSESLAEGQYVWQVCGNYQSSVDGRQSLQQVCSKPFVFFVKKIKPSRLCDLILTPTKNTSFQEARSRYLRVRLLGFGNGDIPKLVIELETSVSGAVPKWTMPAVPDTDEESFVFDLSKIPIHESKVLPVFYSGHIIDPANQDVLGYFRIIFK